MRHLIEGYMKVPCEDWYISFDKMLIRWGPDNQLVVSKLRFIDRPYGREWNYENPLNRKWDDFRTKRSE